MGPKYLFENLVPRGPGVQRNRFVNGEDEQSFGDRLGLSAADQTANRGVYDGPYANQNLGGSSAPLAKLKEKQSEWSGLDAQPLGGPSFDPTTARFAVEIERDRLSKQNLLNNVYN